MARIVKEVVDRGEEGVRWYVFGDDDTVFVVENLVRTLAKYDHDRWFYIGSKSESYDQNVKNSFDMAFGGGGFAISHSLAKVFSRVFDSCLTRYSHLYGSDARVFSCLAELGVGLTHEPGFHQVTIMNSRFILVYMMNIHKFIDVERKTKLETLEKQQCTQQISSIFHKSLR